MKRKVLGLSFLSILCVNFAPAVFAEDTSYTTDTEEKAARAEQTAPAAGEVVEPSDRSDLSPAPRVDRAVKIPAVSATDTNVPTKNFVDVSSNNGYLSVEDFQKMKNYGVTGVVVKLTESTSYINPQSQAQVANAKAAGLKVSAYHYSWFTSDDEARAEADYFAAQADRVGLDKSTVMVSDLEEPRIAGDGDHTANSRAFVERLNQLGFGQVRHYTSVGWLDAGRLDAAALGNKNIWAAAYPYQLSSENRYTQYGAWQWSSQLRFPGVNGNFDISADYTGIFSQTEQAAPPAAEASVPMYRLYNPNSSEHFYTQNGGEKDMLVSVGWNYEGIGWNAPTSGAPVYRLYNPNAGDHHYTLNSYEKDNLVNSGWNYEGISWNSGGNTELYRLYNPNARSGAHHYTMNTNERDSLERVGWRYEGLAWYGK